MPKYRVTQERDAIQYWIAIIEADTPHEARRKALDDDCEWIENGTHQLDDREIPSDQVVAVPEDYIVPRPAIPTVLWLLRIDTADDDPSALIYTDEQAALAAFGAALSDYMTDKERSLYPGDPRAAHQAILDREGGDFPDGHRIDLEEHRLMVTPLSPPPPKGKTRQATHQPWTASIRIQMEDDAFAEDPERELAQTLVDLATRVRQRGVCSMIIRDTNGNSIGELTLSGKRPKVH